MVAAWGSLAHYWWCWREGAPLQKTIAYKVALLPNSWHMIPKYHEKPSVAIQYQPWLPPKWIAQWTRSVSSNRWPPRQIGSPCHHPLHLPMRDDAQHGWTWVWNQQPRQHHRYSCSTSGVTTAKCLWRISHRMEHVWRPPVATVDLVYFIPVIGYPRHPKKVWENKNSTKTQSKHQLFKSFKSKTKAHPTNNHGKNHWTHGHCINSLPAAARLRNCTFHILNLWFHFRILKDQGLAKVAPKSHSVQRQTQQHWEKHILHECQESHSGTNWCD